MRDLPPEFINEINKRGGIRPRTLFTITAQNRDTKLPEVLCLWNGDDHQEFTVEGQTNTYYGAGSIMEIGEITNEVGTNIQKLTLTLSNLTPEVALLLRGYNPKYAQAFVHTMLFSTESDLPITTPLRRFKGWIDKAPISTGRLNAVSSAKVDMVSFSRNLTKLTPSRRSNENQKQRNVNDTMLRDVGMSGLVRVAWGEKHIYSDGSKDIEIFGKRIRIKHDR